MKPFNAYSRVALFVMLLLVSTGSYAQGELFSMNFNLTPNEVWYLQPLLWFGAAVFVGIMLINALRGGRRY